MVALWFRFGRVLLEILGLDGLMPYPVPRYCAKCVLRFDHHCPVICNCVGVDTIGHFVLMYVYQTIGLVYALFMILSALGENLKTPELVAAAEAARKAHLEARVEVEKFHWNYN